MIPHISRTNSIGLIAAFDPVPVYNFARAIIVIACQKVVSGGQAIGLKGKGKVGLVGYAWSAVR